MNKQSVREALDDALSGIKEDAALYQRVLFSARRGAPERKEKKFFVLAAALLLLLTATGTALAAVNGWSVLQFLFPGNGDANKTKTEPVHQEAVSEGARLRVDSAAYDGRTLAFDWSIENTKPEIPMYCRVEAFTANGARVWTDGTDSFDETWMPGCYEDASWQDGEIILLPQEAIGAEKLHVEMKVLLFRPQRPIAQIGGCEDFDPDLAARKIAEGYYVIAGGDGFVVYDGEEEKWMQVFMPKELPMDMGAYQVETLEIRFDVPLMKEEALRLRAEQNYENAHGRAHYETADLTSLGLYLTLKLEPKDDYFRQNGNWKLTDETGAAFLAPLADMSQVRPEGWAAGGTHAEYQWYGLKAEDLPDVISLTWVPDQGENVLFPVRVR